MAHIKNITGTVLHALKEPPTKGDMATLPGLESSFGFETHGEEKLREMLNAAMQFCADMKADSTPYWLTYTGSVDSGKTHLLRRINLFFQKHIDGLRDKRNETPGRIARKIGGWMNWAKCMDHMINGDYGFLRQLKEDWFVGLDDIGTEYEKHANLAATKLYDILNAREGKWTVFTSNLNLEGIAKKIDPRIASRLTRDGAVVIDTANKVPKFNLRKK